MTTPDPIDLVERFRGAVHDGAEDAARAVCADDAWNARTDSFRRLFSQAVRGRLDLQPLGQASRNGDRAAVEVTIRRPDRPNPVGVLYMLSERADGAWILSGSTKVSAQVGLYLQGALPGAVSADDLGEDAAMRAWAGQVAQRLLDDGAIEDLVSDPDRRAAGYVDELQRLAEGYGITVEVVGVRTIPQVSRSLVGLRFAEAGNRREDVRWIGLDHGQEGPPSIVGLTRQPSLEAILSDVEVPWTTAAPETPSPAAAGQALPPDQARQVMEAAVNQALAAMGYPASAEGAATPDPNDIGARIPGLLLGLFSAAMDQATVKRIDRPETPPPAVVDEPDDEPSNVVDLEEERRKKEGKRGPTEFEVRLQTNMRDALGEYVARNVVAEGETVDDVEVDLDFIRDHGPKLIGSLFGAFTRAIAPDGLKVSVPLPAEKAPEPKEGEEPAEPKKVSFNLDLGRILSKALTPPSAESESSED